MRKVEFTIEGKPEAKARPRFSRQTGAVYTPARTARAEKVIRKAYEETGEAPFEGAVIIRITCYYKPPQSWTKKKQEEAAAGVIPKISRPDVDNLAKTVCDGLNKIAWTDDAQITTMIVSKKYGSGDYITISISEDVY